MPRVKTESSGKKDLGGGREHMLSDHIQTCPLWITNALVLTGIKATFGFPGNNNINIDISITLKASLYAVKGD